MALPEADDTAPTAVSVDHPHAAPSGTAAPQSRPLSCAAIRAAAAAAGPSPPSAAAAAAMASRAVRTLAAASAAVRYAHTDRMASSRRCARTARGNLSSAVRVSSIVANTSCAKSASISFGDWRHKAIRNLVLTVVTICDASAHQHDLPGQSLTWLEYSARPIWKNMVRHTSGSSNGTRYDHSL